MKKLLILLMFIIIPSVFSLSGGNTETIFNGNCEKLLVNITITSNIDDENITIPTQDEFELKPNCIFSTQINKTKFYTKSYNCSCINNMTILNLTPAINSVGKYTVLIQQYSIKNTESNIPEEIKTNNPSSLPINFTITLPNNITIKRNISAYTNFTYINNNDIMIIPEDNVTFNSLSLNTETIDMNIQSHGYKCFDVYTTKGIPQNIYVNNVGVSFTYNSTSNILHFCAHFSIKDIIISWVEPVINVVTKSNDNERGFNKVYECSDNIDNDGDGFIDWDGNGNSSLKDIDCGGRYDGKESNDTISKPINNTTLTEPEKQDDIEIVNDEPVIMDVNISPENSYKNDTLIGYFNKTVVDYNTSLIDNAKKTKSNIIKYLIILAIIFVTIMIIKKIFIYKKIKR